MYSLIQTNSLRPSLTTDASFPRSELDLSTISQKTPSINIESVISIKSNNSGKTPNIPINYPLLKISIIILFGSFAGLNN